MMTKRLTVGLAAVTLAGSTLATIGAAQAGS